jgi:gluconolactonase
MKILERGFRYAALIGIAIASAACSNAEPPWSARNKAAIEANHVTPRTRQLPQVDVPLALPDGQPVATAALPAAHIATGVEAQLAWGRGALLERVKMQPDAVYPSQKLDEELIIIVTAGSGSVEFDGRTVEMNKDQVLYLAPGSTRTVRAGAQGWQAIEVYSPVRLDHLALVGRKIDGAKAAFADQGMTPSLQAGVVVNLNDIQWTPLADPAPGLGYRRSGASARMIWGRNAQINFTRIDPASALPARADPEDQLSLTLRGSLERGIMDASSTTSGAAGQVVHLPGGMLHSDKSGDIGADELEVFWPVRTDQVERATQQQALYAEVIAPGTAPRKLAEDFTFSEGPTWLGGKLYFSDMYFRDHKAGDWTGSPARSRLIVMEPDGKWRELSHGMQSNGTIAAANGHLIVCDMFGHRVVEVDPATGKVVKVLLDKVGGKPIDGPNDLVRDARGALYITDPQFTPDVKKSQPGPQIYYLKPDGSVSVVVGAGEFAMPNGVEISPDGRTLYVDNTWKQPGENFVWAYDVAQDGSLSNKRRFAKLNLTPEVLAAEKPEDRFNSSADGTAVDTDGRYYVATSSGVQIFKPDGTFVGTIWLPQYPVNLTFGGPNNDVLYIVGESSVWSIQTKVHGFHE